MEATPVAIDCISTYLIYKYNFVTPSHPALGRSSAHPRDDDPARLYGLSQLPVARVWVPESAVPSAGEQVGAED